MKKDIDDFGFSFSNSMQVKDDTVAKLEGLKKMIMPLLDNLKKNPEKDTIVWPNRVEKIDQFIKKMDDYIKS